MIFSVLLTQWLAIDPESDTAAHMHVNVESKPVQSVAFQ